MAYVALLVRLPLTHHKKDYDQADRYNPAALINKGNTVFVKKDYEKAAEFYKEALRNDSSCTEALYNLGKLNRQSSIQQDHCWELRDLPTMLLLIMYCLCYPFILQGGTFHSLSLHLHLPKGNRMMYCQYSSFALIHSQITHVSMSAN